MIKIIDSWAIKKLWQDWKSNESVYETDNKAYFEAINDMKKRYEKLYYENENFNGLDEKSIKIMIVLNRYFRVIPFHNFGNKINIDES